MKPFGNDVRKRCVEEAIMKDRKDPRPLCRRMIKYFNQFRGSYSSSLILDLGCSVGHNTVCLSEMGFRVCGLDVLPEIVAEANRRGKLVGSEATFVSGVGEHLPFISSSFDFVVLHATLEHVTDWEMVLNEVYRVLKVGGLAYITTTNKLHPFQGEVKFFPLFSYLPQKIKDKIIDKYPASVNYALFPARNWFTPYGLINSLRGIGFTKIWDTFDIRGSDEIPDGIWKISIPFLPLIRMMSHFLRFPFYFFLPGSELLARK